MLRILLMTFSVENLNSSNFQQRVKSHFCTKHCTTFGANQSVSSFHETNCITMTLNSQINTFRALPQVKEGNSASFHCFSKIKICGRTCLREQGIPSMPPCWLSTQNEMSNISI